MKIQIRDNVLNLDLANINDDGCAAFNGGVTISMSAISNWMEVLQEYAKVLTFQNVHIKEKTITFKAPLLFTRLYPLGDFVYAISLLETFVSSVEYAGIEFIEVYYKIENSALHVMFCLEKIKTK